MAHISTYKHAQEAFIIITLALAPATWWYTVHLKKKFLPGTHLLHWVERDKGG